MKKKKKKIYGLFLNYIKLTYFLEVVLRKRELSNVIELYILLSI